MLESLKQPRPRESDFGVTRRLGEFFSAEGATLAGAKRAQSEWVLMNFSKGGSWQGKGRYSAAGISVERRRYETFAGDLLSEKLRMQLVGLTQLQPNWDGEGAGPVHAEVARRAERLLESLAFGVISFKEPAVVPKSDGALQLEWHTDNSTLEFEAHEAGWSIVSFKNDAGNVTYTSEPAVDSDLQKFEQAYMLFTV